jgi:sodium/potassium-transporting ATPase subunit alpha
MLNFGLVFETVLAAIISYTPYLDTALNTYPLKYNSNEILFLDNF